jgi:uncharacterized protein (TIGR02271 family)
MTRIEIRKRIAGISLVLGLAAVAAGCRSASSDSGTYTSYSGTGGTGSSGYTSSSGSGGSSAASSASETSSPAPGQQITVPLYEEQIVVGTRTIESGGVTLRKQVTTETINQPVQVRRETIIVDREPAVSGQTNAQSGSLSTPFEKGELVIRLHSEEPVVEKRIVPTARIVVQTRTNTEQMNVQREVRRENINVDKMGNGKNVVVSEKVGGQTNQAVGAAPAESQQIKGKQSSESATQGTEPGKAPAARDEGQPFPRPQPDGRETFPELNKSPERK